MQYLRSLWKIIFALFAITAPAMNGHREYLAKDLSIWCNGLTMNENPHERQINETYATECSLLEKGLFLFNFDISYFTHVNGVLTQAKNMDKSLSVDWRAITKIPIDTSVDGVVQRSWYLLIFPGRQDIGQRIFIKD